MSWIPAQVAKFEAETDEMYAATVEKLVRDGNARWIDDPLHPGCVGLVKVIDGQVTREAYVVIYADGDWATSDDLEFEVDHL